MRTLNLTFLLVFFTLTAFAQVGIGTTSPHPGSMLDVNGTLRIRDLTLGSNNAAKDSILVIDGRGFVYRIPTRDLLANMDKSLVKANFSGSTGVNLTAATQKLLVFDNEEFDINNEYDPLTGIFTAKRDGIYRVTGSIEQGSVTVGDYGLMLYKNSEVVAQERYLNVGVEIDITLLSLDVAVSSPYRKVSTLVELSAGDELSLMAYSFVAVGISTGQTESYFTIEQVR
ncbi:MAG: hypothetical protein CL868_15300 [Cytophagaceae bacterium]|nr:hypothetical protein [Cytophagaceae bacterium]|tara:strand:- start:225 stop:908 length:684 start_codon:yes stop_codon:yes gene_type:complete